MSLRVGGDTVSEVWPFLRGAFLVMETREVRGRIPRAGEDHRVERTQAASGIKSNASVNIISAWLSCDAEKVKWREE